MLDAVETAKTKEANVLIGVDTLSDQTFQYRVSSAANRYVLEMHHLAQGTSLAGHDVGLEGWHQWHDHNDAELFTLVVCPHNPVDESQPNQVLDIGVAILHSQCNYVCQSRSE